MAAGLALEGPPLAVTVALSLVSFVFAAVAGIAALWLLLIILWSDASPGGLVAAGVIYLVFAAFAIAGISRLGVHLIWPVVGVVTGFAGSLGWLIWAFRDFGE